MAEDNSTDPRAGLRKSPEAQLSQAACHLAGIAVAALHLGIPIRKSGVSLADIDARLLLPSRKRNRLSAENMAVAHLTGWAAARRRRPAAIDEWTDWESARLDASATLTPFTRSRPELDAYLVQVQQRALKLVADPRTWAEIRAVAGALVDRLRLSAAEVIEVCEPARNAVEAEWRKNHGG